MIVAGPQAPSNKTNATAPALIDNSAAWTPKNGDGNSILGPWFPTGNPGIGRLTDNLKLEFSDRKPRNCWGNPNTEAGFPNGNPNFNRNF